ncbi:amidohydrolase family protein [Kordiimonas sp.]|uniref:amidohydrolase family protein n=1 Tax=Kordiimonas sp. TaxID=1970157 RepID=UPI003B51CC08
MTGLFSARSKTRSLLAGVALVCMTGPALAADDWDIADTGQPYIEAEFTLDEGTWMSLDVSPDGKTIVFDLLGDLYLLPVHGGEAVPLTSGPAIDRTPSFSPDGSKILYISDANGADNVWMVGMDGTGARAVTTETTNLVANPAWSADGNYIIAAIVGGGYSDQKSSTLRMYHISGGQGRVVVETPANGRDVQEPEFSRDGKYLYYTQRLKDHHIYVDANHINYGVMQRDLKSGETEQLVAGFGGALAPQVSPSGRYIAFVRRVKDKTVLFTYDRETGTQRPVYDNLDRDQQADFYLQGVYFPKFGWFPDEKSVAIWGKGKLYRVNIETGKASGIPFKAHSKHRITQSPRFAPDFEPDSVTVRSAQSLKVSPDGKYAVFHALGYLYKKRLPDGAPVRLTKGTAFEFEPSWSSDGKHIAYITWDDEKGSTLKVMRANGKGVKTVASSRGVMRAPAFSSDGKRLVFTTDGGNKGLGGYRTRPGLYTVDTKADATPERIGDGGTDARFSPDDSRVYFTGSDGYDSVLYSVTTGGFDKREHARASTADRFELTLSPDQRWLAFKENQQYYVMPYLETGQPLDVRATGAAVPVRRLSKTSGYNISWSADSSSLYWTLGDAIFSAAPTGDGMPEAFESLGLDVKADKPEGMVAFTGGRVITMKGEEVLEAGTVLVDGGTIKAVGAVGELDVPAGAYVVDTTGKTVMPGLVDMHGHIDCCYYGGLMPQKHSSHYAAAAFGVTTNYDPYTSELPSYAATEMQQAGVLVGPRSVTTGRVIYGRPGKGDNTYVPIGSLEDAADTMARKRALGGRIIKSYKQPFRKARQQLVKAGRDAGVMVDAEGESHFYYNISQLLDGHMALEHNIPVATYYDDIIQLMAHGEAANTPTLNVTFGEIMGENYLYQTTRAWEDPKVMAYVQESTSGYSPTATPYSAPVHVRNMTSLHAADEIYDIGFRAVSRSTKKLDDAGVTINAGSHGQVYGLALHWEMWSMAEGGMDNHRILRTATLNGAKTLGAEDKIGSLEVGKLADIIVLDDNPLEDIKNTNTVRFTMIGGRLYDSLSMNEIGNYDRPRSKFYWELPDYHGIDWNEAWAGQ